MSVKSAFIGGPVDWSNIKDKDYTYEDYINDRCQYYFSSPEVTSKNFSAFGVSVTINKDGTVDITGAKSLNFVAEEMSFDAKNINMNASEHMTLKSKRIDLNPKEET